MNWKPSPRVVFQSLTFLREDTNLNFVRSASNGYQAQTPSLASILISMQDDSATLLNSVVQLQGVSKGKNSESCSDCSGLINGMLIAMIGDESNLKGCNLIHSKGFLNDRKL